MRRAVPLAGVCVLAVAVAGCARQAAPPEPGVSTGMAPDLRGRRVMVLPVQQVVGVAGDPDAELTFGLQGRGAEVDWILPADVERRLERSPGIDARTRGLPVSAFVQAEVRRVGDPLYGELRRMSALVDAELVLLPVRAAAEQVDSSGTAVRLHTALLDVRSGRVLWFSVDQGDPHPPGDPRALASAMDVLARRLLR
ncbi:MAG: hypothetical protein RJQ04_01160 [Longimicrobiales bacterium]